MDTNLELETADSWAGRLKQVTRGRGGKAQSCGHVYRIKDINIAQQTGRLAWMGKGPGPRFTSFTSFKEEIMRSGHHRGDIKVLINE